MKVFNFVSIKMFPEVWAPLMWKWSKSVFHSNQSIFKRIWENHKNGGITFTHITRINSNRNNNIIELFPLVIHTWHHFVWGLQHQTRPNWNATYINYCYWILTKLTLAPPSYFQNKSKGQIQTKLCIVFMVKALFTENLPAWLALDNLWKNHCKLVFKFWQTLFHVPCWIWYSSLMKRQSPKRIVIQLEQNCIENTTNCGTMLWVTNHSMMRWHWARQETNPPGATEMETSSQMWTVKRDSSYIGTNLQENWGPVLSWKGVAQGSTPVVLRRFWWRE